MGKIISFANHKGGVGKTCSTVNIGAGLSKHKKRVLLVDLDPQANPSLSLGIRESKNTIYHVLTAKSSFEEILIKATDTLHIIPSSLDLSGAELELASETGREFILKELLDPLKDKYDFILIDCPPS